MSFEEYLNSLRGKTVSVIGVGVSNRPLIEKLLERGIDVTARDKKENLGELGQALAAQGCKLRLGSAYLADLREDVIFRTPGLRPDMPEIAAAVANGSVLTSEMEAFFDVCPCPILQLPAPTARPPQQPSSPSCWRRRERLSTWAATSATRCCATPRRLPRRTWRCWS